MRVQHSVADAISLAPVPKNLHQRSIGYFRAYSRTISPVPSRAVVHHDDLSVPTAFRVVGENLIQCVCDACALVVCWHDDAICRCDHMKFPVIGFSYELQVVDSKLNFGAEKSRTAA